MGSGLLLLPGELYITKQGDNTAAGKSSAQDPPPRHEITKAPQPCCPLPASGCSHMIGKKTPQPRCRGSVRQAHRLPTVPREKWRAISIHRVCMAHCAINAVATALLPILARRWRGVRRAGLKIEADQAGQVGPRVVFCGLVWASCDPVLVFSALLRPLRSRTDRAERLSAASTGCCAAKRHRADGCSATCPVVPCCGGWRTALLFENQVKLPMTFPGPVPVRFSAVKVSNMKRWGGADVAALQAVESTVIGVKKPLDRTCERT